MPVADRQGMKRNLRTTLHCLHASGIAAAAKITTDGKLEVSLGDGDKGICDSTQYEPHQASQAAAWLAASALIHYPASDFSKVLKFITRLATSPDDVDNSGKLARRPMTR
jgi:hypothetical protein